MYGSQRERRLLITGARATLTSQTKHRCRQTARWPDHRLFAVLQDVSRLQLSHVFTGTVVSSC